MLLSLSDYETYFVLLTFLKDVLNSLNKLVDLIERLTLKIPNYICFHSILIIESNLENFKAIISVLYLSKGKIYPGNINLTKYSPILDRLN